MNYSAANPLRCCAPHTSLATTSRPCRSTGPAFTGRPLSLIPERSFAFSDARRTTSHGTQSPRSFTTLLPRNTQRPVHQHPRCVDAPCFRNLSLSGHTPSHCRSPLARASDYSRALRRESRLPLALDSLAGFPVRCDLGVASPQHRFPGPSWRFPLRTRVFTRTGPNPTLLPISTPSSGREDPPRWGAWACVICSTLAGQVGTGDAVPLRPGFHPRTPCSRSEVISTGMKGCGQVWLTRFFTFFSCR